MNVAKFPQKLPSGDSPGLKSRYTPTYRHVIQFGEKLEKDLAYYSIDTGQNENPISGDTFTFNERFMSGEMYLRKLGTKLEDSETDKLELIQLNEDSIDRGLLLTSIMQTTLEF